jgi:hypothetical protein
MNGNVTIIPYQVGHTQVRIEYLGHYHQARQKYVEVYAEMITQTPAGVTTNPNLKIRIDDHTPVPMVYPDGTPVLEGEEEDARQRTISQYQMFVWQLWDERNPDTLPLERVIREGILRRMGQLPALTFTLTPAWEAAH